MPPPPPCSFTIYIGPQVVSEVNAAPGPASAAAQSTKLAAMSETLSAIVTDARPRREQPALYVGLHADVPGAPPARVSLTGLDRVDIGRADTRRIKLDRIDGVDLVQLGLADSRLSQRHARLDRLGTSWVFQDLDSKNGSWLAGQRISRRPLKDNDVVVVGHTALVFRATGGEAPTLATANAGPAHGMATMSAALAARFADLAVAARGRVAIEINGETGTGKELIARGVHKLSERPGAFVAVNCGAIASSLVEGELFGHRKGAFTGATDERVGLIRAADHGTLFLDEIAELPASSQTSLLRVLQEGEVTPIGGDRPVRVDLRVVTATHQNLADAVAAGRFRADLRARLLGFQFVLPPLRDRREDLSLLVAELLGSSGAAPPSGFAMDVVGALYAYDWPLNIRELERALAAATAVPRDRIDLTALPVSLQTVFDAEPGVDDSMLTPDERELRDQLVGSIARHDGNLAEVGREMAKDRTQIRRWMKRFGLRR
jgi:DNA-binding NtrC family response regulator